MIMPILHHLSVVAFLCQILVLPSVHAQGEGVNSDIDWLSDLPYGAGDGVTYDGWRADQNHGDWVTMEKFGPYVLFDWGSTTAYRLTKDNSNIVVLKSEGDAFTMTAVYTGDSSNAPDMDNTAIFGTDFSYSENPTASSGDITTNSSGFQVLEGVVQWDADNSYCTDTKTIVASYTDASGAANTSIAVNSIYGGFTALPAYLNLTIQEYPGDLLQLSFHATNLVSYKVGDGPVEPYVPAATLQSLLTWCTSDVVDPF